MSKTFAQFLLILKFQKANPRDTSHLKPFVCNTDGLWSVHLYDVGIYIFLSYEVIPVAVMINYKYQVFMSQYSAVHPILL